MNLITLYTLDSTNNYLKIHEKNLPHFTVVRARYQTFGRGQFTRQWLSNPNENILVSFLFKKFKSLVTIQKIEKMAIEICQNFFTTFGVKATHKLPNDLIVNGKKIAGMLIETKQIETTFAYVIVGIGININQQTFSSLPHATSLAILTKKSYDIDEIFSTFLKESRTFENL
jgi:BirA family biotin operon repressor/biotin-[acetyl-CoA-carboxylase] ligase